MPLVKVWSGDRRLKKFVVAEELDSVKTKGITVLITINLQYFYLYSMCDTSTVCQRGVC